MSCAQRHGVFLNRHFWGIGFGAKRADITAFSGLYPPNSIPYECKFGEIIWIWEDFWGFLSGLGKC